MAKHETATLGGGCFWCLEAVFEQLQGVDKVVSGYAGGHVNDPDYEAVCGGQTGHAEVVQVTFDPTTLSFEDLLEVFFSVHDPTTPNRQGADVGPQYRSILFHHSETQKKSAEAVVRRLEGEKLWPARFVTESVPFVEFFPAEDYHQQYFRRNPHQRYCRAIITPKVAKFRQAWAARLKATA